MDPLTHPLVIALLALLGIPAVTSGVTGAIKFLSDMTGVSPKVLVYGVSLALTGALLALTSTSLPSWEADPVVFVAAWLAWATVNAELARRIYETLWERLYPEDED